MRSEISTLLPDNIVDGVQSALVGGNIYLRQLDADWIERVRSEERVAARELLDWGPYTHRFCYESPARDEDLDRANRVTDDDQQSIRRAIALSRIVKPTAVAYDNVWIKSFYLDSGEVMHFSRVNLNQFSIAYVPETSLAKRLTAADAELMTRLWDNLIYLLTNEPQYRRIVRALKYYELAHAIYFAELSHPVFHAALESLICTTHRHNAAQVIQRLTQLVPAVNDAQAREIYKTCCDFKHAAEALQQTQTNTGILAPEDQRRLDAVRMLRQSVRELLLECLRDREFADVLADPVRLSNTYQVFVRGQQV